MTKSQLIALVHLCFTNTDAINRPSLVHHTSYDCTQTCWERLGACLNGQLCTLCLKKQAPKSSGLGEFTNADSGKHPSRLLSASIAHGLCYVSKLDQSTICNWAECNIHFQKI